MRKKPPISAFCINYNGRDYLKGCLESLTFCEQLIYVDKSSTDDSVRIARNYTDEIYVVEWSPIVEQTRAFALSKCRLPWVFYLDHDEMVDAGLVNWLDDFTNNSSFDAAKILRKNYYFGDWSKRQRSWPSRHIRLFRRDAGHFVPTIHTTVQLSSNRIYKHREEDGGAIIHHGCETLAQWIEKVNRYTSSTTWSESPLGSGDEILENVEALLNRAKAEFHAKGGESYEAVSHLLFFIYKTIDTLKNWESKRGRDAKQEYLDSRDDILKGIRDMTSGVGPR
jgi:glycosyltransferase involved in cell wall biosynthesis